MDLLFVLGAVLLVFVIGHLLGDAGAQDIAQDTPRDPEPHGPVWGGNPPDGWIEDEEEQDDDAA